MPRARGSGQELVDRRPDPLAGLDLDADEPVVALGQLPSALERPPGNRKRQRRRRPSEERRTGRRISITLSNPELPERIRALAEHWHLYAPSGDPNVSAVVEYLIVLNLSAAERGELPPPESRMGQK